MKLLRWSITMAKPLWREFALAVLLALAAIASGIGLLATSAYLIAKAALQPSIADLQVAIVGVRFLGLSRGILRYAERYVSHNVTFKLLAQIRVWFYRELEPLAPAALAGRHSGDLLARIIDDIETLQFLFLRVLQPPLVAALGMLVLTFLLIPLSVQLALLWLVLLATAGIVIPLLTNRAGRSHHRALATLRASFKEKAVDLIQGLPDLIAFGEAKSQLEALLDEGQLKDSRRQRLDILDAAAEGTLTGLNQLAPVAILWLAMLLLTGDQLDGVQLTVLVVTALASFELVLPLTASLSALQASLSASQRLFNLVDIEPPIREPATPRLTDDISPCDLEVEGLELKYTTRDLPAIHGISFSIDSGQRAALVGPSGAGKSSLFHVLLRFWDYQGGSIRLGGRDLRSLSGEDARALFSVMSQRPMLFSGTLRENLLLARPSATESELRQALASAGAESLLEILSHGLDTPLGEWGWHLSAGQQRRVALARTLLQDRPYLLLDEPTANLDPAVSRKIRSDVLSATAGKTTLYISHDLAGMDAFDAIFVFSEGEIIQQGTHTELVAQAGLYSQLWQLQFERKQIERELA
ncbi:MAG: thiol reductant ABC exporter subunit CydC [Anaerolineales bacterium]